MNLTKNTIKFSILILTVFCCAILSCENKPHNAVKNELRPKNALITFTNQLSGKESFSLYQITLYDNGVFPTAFNGPFPAQHKVNVSSPVFFLSLDLNKIFFLKPGENVFVSANSTGNAQLIIRDDSVRTNELAFSEVLNCRYPEPRIALKINNANQFNQAAKVLHEWYLSGRQLLQTSYQSKLISAQFVEVMGKYLYYKSLSDLLKSVYTSPSAAAIIKGSVYEKFSVCDSCLNMPHYFMALYYHNEIMSGYRPGDSGFAKEFNTAKLNYTGASRKFLLFRSIKSHERGNMTLLEEKSHEFATMYPHDTLTNILDADFNNVRASKTNHTVAEQTLMTANGKKVKWQEILAAHRHKVILIDFWARYCGPCVAEMPFSKKLEKEFKDVVFVYVSFDNSKNNWLAGMDEVKMDDRDDSYLLDNIDRKAIFNFYHVQYIPKYVVYDKQGIIADAYAPRPSDPALKKILENLGNKN